MNVIQEYLVRLGFEPDEPAFRRFQGTMELADRTVERHATGMLKWVLGIPTGVMAAFGSITAAAAGMMDQVAQADQGYRLMGLRMMMTTESARKLDMVTKALGADLPSIIWDPELHARAEMMGADIDRMTAALGTGFSGSMRGIRDFRAEIGRVEIGLKFLTMHFAQDVFKKLVPGRDAISAVHEWVTNLQDKIPMAADRMATVVVPIMRQTWEMAKAGGRAIKAAGWAFTELVAYFSHDDAIRGKAFDFEHFSQAVQHVGDWIVDLAGKIPEFINTAVEKFEGFMRWLPGFAARVKDEFQSIRMAIVNALHDGGEALGHFASALDLVAHGHFKAASEQFSQMASAAQKVVADLSPKKPGAMAMKQNEQPEPEKPASFLPQRGHFYEWLMSPAPGDESEQNKQSKPTGHTGAQMEMSDDRIMRLSRGSDETAADWWRRVSEGRGLSGLWDYATKSKEDLLFERDIRTEGREPKTVPAPALRGHVNDGGLIVREMAAAIARYEAGSKRAAISISHNNPGNLRTWGDYPVVNGFVKFPDWATGMQALREQVERNIERGLTPREFFAGKQGVYPGYAPRKDGNDPDAYASTVSKWLKIDPDKPLKDDRPDNSADILRWLQNPPKWYIEPPAWLGNPAVAAVAPIRELTPAPAAANREVRIQMGDLHIAVNGSGLNESQLQRAVADGALEAQDRITASVLAQLATYA